MGNILFYILSLGMGAALATQAGVNSQLRTAINNPLAAALISNIIGTTVMAVVILLTRQSFPSKELLSSIVSYKYLGGFMGAYIVITMIYTVPRLGVAPMFATVVAGQLLIGLIYGHFGWLGVKVSPMTVVKGVGVVLMIVGAYLINK